MKSLGVAALLFIVGSSTVCGQSNTTKESPARIQGDDKETLWTKRFAHCDYGFYVILPAGYVGHSSPPGYPCHGFSIRLSNVGTSDDESSLQGSRVIWVNAEYNSYDLKSLSELTDWQIEMSGRDERDFKMVGRSHTRLDHRTAERVRYEYSGLSGPVIEERVFALRSGILYEICLRTTPSNYADDVFQLNRILSNFRWWKIHYCP